jgi:hypothetical protein
MFITTSYTSNGTHKAAIRSSADHRVLYTATSTSSEEAAAKAAVAKNWNHASAQTVRELTDPAEIRLIIGDFQRSPQRKQVFRLWTFNPAAK